MSLSERDVDTVLIRALADDLGGNDNSVTYPEEMTEQQARSLRIDELRVADVELARVASFLSLTARGSRTGATFAPALHDEALNRVRAVRDMLERALELEGV